ncbi:MAG: hypothetical protein WEA36_07050 [Balneolaceae bacterium]
MIKIQSIILNILFLFITIYFIYTINSTKKDLNNLNIEMESLVYKISDIIEKSISESKSVGIFIDNISLTSIQNRSNKNFNDLINGDRKILLRYSSGCMVCTNEDILMSNLVLNELGSENVIIISSSPEESIHSFMHRNSYIKDIFMVDKGALNIPIDEMDLGYIAVINENYEVKSLFTPKDSYREIVRYVTHVKQTYF